MWLIYMMLIASPRPHYPLKTPRDSVVPSLYVDSFSGLTQNGALPECYTQLWLYHGCLYSTEEDRHNLILSLLLGVKIWSLQSGEALHWSHRELPARSPLSLFMTSCQGSPNSLSWVLVLPSAWKGETGGDSSQRFGSLPGLSLFGSLPILSCSHLLCDTRKRRLFLSKNGCMECLMILCPVSQ